MHFTTNTHCTTSSLSGSQHIHSLFSLLPQPMSPPPPAPPSPANADLGLHTKIFPTILGHEFISILGIVFVSLVYFFPFLICRSAGLTAKKKPFLMPPSPHPRFMSGEHVDRGERNIFWRNVPFSGAVWESWFQSHRESFHYSPFNVFRLFLGGLVYVLQKWFLWNEVQSKMDAYPSDVGTLGGGGPVGWPRMNLEMHFAPKFRISF